MIPQYEPMINRKILASKIREYIHTDGYFTEYKHTEAFEYEIKTRFGVKHCFMVNNGTISLSLALLASGVEPGDKVLVPNITMIATANAVKFIGAEPVFVDVDPHNLCMNLEQAKEKVQSKTIDKLKAVIYVSLNGRQHRKEELTAFYSKCKGCGVEVIEDNAQAFGSWNSSKNWITAPEGGIGSYSFSMPKIITTGQGGCLVTNDDELALKIKRLKDFGRDSGGTDTHNYFGINCKFTEMQAIMGLNQWNNIDERVGLKRLIYKQYREALKDIPEIKWLETDLNYVTPWFMDIYIEDRDELVEYLEIHGIKSREIYPPLTSQKIYKDKAEMQLDYSLEWSKKGLWLPSSMTLTEDQINKICDTIKSFYEYKRLNDSPEYVKPIKVDSCLGHELYESLKDYNQLVDEACMPFKFIDGRDYITEKNEASWWFDPKKVRKLSISHVYPNCLPVQEDPRFCLTLYAPNYFGLLLINTLYPNKDIKIEEQAGGMGRFMMYLSKLGYKNFHMVDNFSQLPKALLESMASKGGFTYDLNNSEYVPDVLCHVGLPYFVKEVRKETELVITYNNVLLIKLNPNGTFSYVMDDEDKYVPLEGKKLLAVDRYGMAKAYCNEDKLDEFREKLKIYGDQ